MRCPNCEVDLVMADRLGIEIDYCPKCRGVWLDRGELDKIIERSMASQNQVQPPFQQGGYPPNPNNPYPQRPYRGHDDDDDDDDDDRHGYQEQGYGKKRRRGGFLGDLFGGD